MGKNWTIKLKDKKNKKKKFNKTSLKIVMKKNKTPNRT